LSVANPYAIEPFLGTVRSGLRPQETAEQLEALLNRSTQMQSQVVLVGTVSVRIEPGCLGRLLGNESAWIRHDQVVIGPQPRQSGSGGVTLADQNTFEVVGERESIREVVASMPAASSTIEQRGASTAAVGSAGVDAASAPREPVLPPTIAAPHEHVSSASATERAAGIWGGLSKGARLAIGAIGALAVALWLYAPSRGPSPASEVARTPVAPSQQPPTTTLPVANRTQQSPTRTEGQLPLPSQRADAPRVRVGDRWVTDVVDHQDSKLNYRSERIVQEAGNDRIVTSVRTLKNNYTRTVEYDNQWALVMTRLPTGAATSFAPALPYFSFPASPGKSWQARIIETGSSGTQKVHDIRGTIGSWETVTVPAGSFAALKIVLADDITENGVLIQQGQDVSWYVPAVRRTVKTEETSFNPTSGERRQRTISLIEYSVQ
jgi:hypothetical protein